MYEVTKIFYQLAEQLNQSCYLRTDSTLPIKVELPKAIFSRLRSETHNYRLCEPAQLRLYTPSNIEFIFTEAKEAPKKRKVRMAPAIFKDGNRHYITGQLYSSEEAARAILKNDFIKWLIDTSYEVTVEEEVSDDET